MHIIAAIGTLLGGVGIFFMGIGVLYWISTQDEEKKAKKAKQE
jgi:hypothetical protein